MVNNSKYAEELEALLAEDQEVWRSFWQMHYRSQGTPAFAAALKEVRMKLRKHSDRMLAILKSVGEPSLQTIGPKGAQAMSVIALHSSEDTLAKVLKAFTDCYDRDKTDVYYQAIPSTVDRLRILERKPQRFGTQWEVDEGEGRFLPTVEDFESVDERRKEYGIEPLRWPKSLAIPESEQPWLARPLSDLVMRDITDDEFARYYQDYT